MSPVPVSSCLAAHTRFQRPCFFWCFLRLCCKTPYRTSVLKRIWRITFRSICRIYPSICPSGHNFSVSFVPSRHTFRSKDAQFCALGTGICFHFLFSRQDRFPSYYGSLGLLSAYTDRKFRRTRTWMLVFSENVFYDTVFQRMKGDDTKSSTVI